MIDTGLRGAELLAEAVRQIKEEPETWDQSRWGGRAHCVGARCLRLAGIEPVVCSISNLASILHISNLDVAWLSCLSRTLEEICHFSETLTYGFDKDGFDRDGYKRNGKDKYEHSRIWNFHLLNES